MVSVIARDLLDGVIFQIPTFQMHTFGFLFGVAIFSTTKIAEVIRDQKIYHDNKNNKTIMNFGQIGKYSLRILIWVETWPLIKPVLELTL